MRQIRDGIPEEERRAKSGRIADHLTAEDWYADAKELLVYAAIRSEAELSAFCERANCDGKRLYFPKVRDENIEFYQIWRREQLAPGKFGVMEPVTDAFCGGRLAAGQRWKGEPGEKTPILVPGLAFSRSGARMGYGGGYYDRYLALHAELLPVGICYEAQLTEQIPMEAWDRRMERIVTERGSYVTGRGSEAAAVERGGYGIVPE